MRVRRKMRYSGARLDWGVVLLNRSKIGEWIDLADGKAVDVFSQDVIDRRLQRRHVPDEEVGQLVPYRCHRLGGTARRRKRQHGQPSIAVQSYAPAGFWKVALEPGLQVFE